MLAISPNRKSAPEDLQTGKPTRLLMQSMRIAAVFAVLVGVCQRSWSQSGVSEPASQQSAVHFVAPGESCEHPVVAEAKVVPARPTTVGTPTFVPPLSVADYANYIKREWIGLSSKARPATSPAPSQAATEVSTPPVHTQLSLITPVESAKRPGKVTPEQPPQQVAVTAPSAPIHETPRVASNEPPKSQPRSTSAPIHESENEHAAADGSPESHSVIVSAPNRNVEASVAEVSVGPSVDLSALYNSPPVSNSQSTNASDLVSEPDRDSSNSTDRSYLRVAKVSEVNVNPSYEAEQRTPLLAQTSETPKPLPTPTEPTKVERAPASAESMPTAAVVGPSVPLTTSSFLPANPEEYCFRCGVKCPPCGCNPGGPGWAASRPIPWEVFAQGEYVGPARLAHVPIYRLRVDDRLAFVYRLSGQVSGQPYRLNVRDRIQVQSLSAPEVVNREVIVEPDGTITLPLLGQVRAAGATLDELSKRLDEQFKDHIKDPRITVAPIEMNSNLQELRSSVDRRYGAGGQVSDARISPDGTVQLPAIGSVPAQGLTLEELEREIKARYAQIVEGLEVTPILTERAPRFVFVVGEVKLPGAM